MGVLDQKLWRQLTEGYIVSRVFRQVYLKFKEGYLCDTFFYLFYTFSGLVLELQAKKASQNKSFFLHRSARLLYPFTQGVKEIDLHGFQRCHFLDS